MLGCRDTATKVVAVVVRYGGRQGLDSADMAECGRQRMQWCDGFGRVLLGLLGFGAGGPDSGATKRGQIDRQGPGWGAMERPGASVQPDFSQCPLEWALRRRAAPTSQRIKAPPPGMKASGGVWAPLTVAQQADMEPPR